MSSSTTNSVPPARWPSCCWSACCWSSSSSVASSPSIVCWGRNEDSLTRPDRLVHRLRAGAGLSDPAGADHRADLVLQRTLPDLPAAIVVVALVRAVFLQFGLDAGHARHADGGCLDRSHRHAARRRRGVRDQSVKTAHHAPCPHDAAAAAGGADYHHGGRHLL